MTVFSLACESIRFFLALVCYYFGREIRKFDKRCALKIFDYQNHFDVVASPPLTAESSMQHAVIVSFKTTEILVKNFQFYCDDSGFF